MSFNWTVKKTNKHRCSLLTKGVIINLIRNWYENLLPSDPIQSIQINLNDVGGLFDVYYDITLINSSNIYMIRFYIIYIPIIKKDIFDCLNKVIHIKETLEKIQIENTELLINKTTIPYQSIPYPFNTCPNPFANQVVMLVHSKYDETQIGIDYEIAKKLFSVRGVQLIQYEILT
jgi:hypothetical protein